MSEVDSVQWIDAYEALKLAEQSGLDRSSAKATLADYLKDGELRARAARKWESDHPNINDAWEDRQAAEAETDVEVTKEDWRYGRFWADDLALWRWEENRFVVTHGRKKPDRMILEGVQFSTADLARLVSTETTKPKGKGGRPRNMQEWDLFWMEVVRLAQNGKLQPGQWKSQRALRDAVHERLTDEETGKELLSWESIESRVSAVWNRFVQPG